jgi:hypothetical protein
MSKVNKSCEALVQVPYYYYYLGSFNTNYIISRHVSFFFSLILKNILFVEVKIEHFQDQAAEYSTLQDSI